MANLDSPEIKFYYRVTGSSYTNTSVTLIIEQLDMCRFMDSN